MTAPDAALQGLAFRATHAPPNAWFVAETDEPSDVVAAAVAEALGSFADAGVELAAADTSERIEALLTKLPRETHVVLYGLDAMPPTAWTELDLARTRLERSASVTMVLGPRTLGRLVVDAPHLASWISVHRLEPGAARMTAAEVEARLSELRAEHGLSDDRILALAESSSLPPEPWAAEWLALLERLDLVGPS